MKIVSKIGEYTFVLDNLYNSSPPKKNLDIKFDY